MLEGPLKVTYSGFLLRAGRAEQVDCGVPHQMTVEAVALQPPQAAIVYYGNLDM